jgi:hypothetical protein
VSPWRLHFILRRLIFVGPQYRTCFMSHLWRVEFWCGAENFRNVDHRWVRGKWQASCPGCLTPRGRVPLPTKAGWAPWVDLDTVIEVEVKWTGFDLICTPKTSTDPARKISCFKICLLFSSMRLRVKTYEYYINNSTCDVLSSESYRILRNRI